MIRRVSVILTTVVACLLAAMTLYAYALLFAEPKPFHIENEVTELSDRVFRAIADKDAQTLRAVSDPKVADKLTDQVINQMHAMVPEGTVSDPGRMHFETRTVEITHQTRYEDGVPTGQESIERPQVTTATLISEYRVGEKFVHLSVSTRKAGEFLRLTRATINSESRSLLDINSVSFRDLSANIGGILIAAMLSTALVLVSLYSVWRDNTLRFRFLWLIFVASASILLRLDWLTSEIVAHTFGFHLPTIQFSINPIRPPQVILGIPTGAFVFWAFVLIRNRIRAR